VNLPGPRTERWPAVQSRPGGDVLSLPSRAPPRRPIERPARRANRFVEWVLPADRRRDRTASRSGLVDAARRFRARAAAAPRVSTIQTPGKQASSHGSRRPSHAVRHKRTRGGVTETFTDRPRPADFPCRPARRDSLSSAALVACTTAAGCARTEVKVPYHPATSAVTGGTEEVMFPPGRSPFPKGPSRLASTMPPPSRVRRGS
jgi:hypothetical protein